MKETAHNGWFKKCEDAVGRRKVISGQICQNAFPSRLVKNELWVFLESLGPPPSSTYTIMALAGL